MRAARRIHVEEFIPLQPRGLAHQIIADPLFAEQEPDLARKGTERKLIELPHAHLCSARVAICQRGNRSEEHTSELQSLMRISYAVFCLKKKKNNRHMKKLTTVTYKNH